MSKTIFLSYARGDDEPFVTRLHADLSARGFDVWWDRVSMPARGLTFLHEIRDAIDARERFLLVLGPKATTSDYVIAEWQHSVTYGKAINPILRLGDFPLVPDELKLLHVEDFRDNARYTFHLENLVRQLSEPVAPMGKLVGVPSLPRHLLTRSERLQSLKEALLADLQRPVVMTGVAARVGVHGMSGIGKSVLANLLARDTEVRRAFPDGIVWVPLGTQPNLVELQRNVAKVFADPGYFENAAQGRAKLGELLAPKAVLLVLDDVWERAHAEAFNVLGPRCRAVITTRDAGLVTSLGGTQHQVQLFSVAESLDLLAGAAGVNANALPPEAKEIVSECGCLPLAIALCAGMFKRGVTWTSIVQRLKQIALESIGDRNAENAQHRNLWTAIKVSVDALTPHEQRRFIELSVFPNDQTVPEAAVRTLWSHTTGLDEFACEDLLLSLSERSLIRLASETPRAGQTPRRHVSLHDLLHDFATRLAGDPAPLHNQLLNAYRKLCPNGWPTGPNDGYYFQNLIRHLLLVGHHTEAAAVLLESTFQERIESHLGLYELSDSFDFVEKVTHGLTALAGPACFLILVTKTNHPSWQKEDRDHMNHVQTLVRQFKRISATSQEWLREETSAKACARFGMKTFQSLDADLWDRNVENAVAALRAYCENGASQRRPLENVHEILAPALIQAKDTVVVRGPSKTNLGYGATDTAAYADDFEAAFLSSIDASLALQPTAMCRFLTAALHFKALYDCDSDPVGAIPFAMERASERFEELVSGSISSFLEEGGD